MKSFNKYLALTLAFIIGLSMSASAVIVDPYKVAVIKDSDGDVKYQEVFTNDTDAYKAMEDGTYDGDFTEDKHVSSVDTSTFTNEDEYRSYLNNEFLTTSEDKPYRIFQTAAYAHVEPFQSILREMVSRNIVNQEDIVNLLFAQIIAAGRITHQQRPAWVANCTEAINMFENIDPSTVSVDLDYSDHHRSLAAAYVKVEGGSDSAFENMWSIIKDKQTDYQKAIHYHNLKGENQVAYDMLKALVENDRSAGDVLSAITGNGYGVSKDTFPKEEPVLWDIVTPVDTEFLSNTTNIARMVKVWNSIKWHNYTNEEIINICDKYNVTIPTTDTTVPFKEAVKQKKSDIQ